MQSVIARVFLQSFRYEPDNCGDIVYVNNRLVTYDPSKHEHLDRFSLQQVNEPSHNTMVLEGRKYLGYLITSLASGGFSWCMAGSSTVAIDTINDDRLGGYSGSATPAFEYIGNTTRKKLQSTLYGGDLTTADWVADSYTDGSGNTYRVKCQANVTFGPGDSNGTVSGVPLQRYGFNSSSRLPSTTSGYSGLMLNEMIDTASQNLTNSNIVQTKFILRI